MPRGSLIFQHRAGLQASVWWHQICLGLRWLPGPICVAAGVKMVAPLQGPDELADMVDDAEVSSAENSATGSSPTAARPGGR